MFPFKFGVGALISCISLLSSLLSFPLLFYLKERRFTRSVFLTPLKPPHLRLHFWSHKKKKIKLNNKKQNKKDDRQKGPVFTASFQRKMLARRVVTQSFARCVAKSLGLRLPPPIFFFFNVPLSNGISSPCFYHSRMTPSFNFRVVRDI